MGEEKIADTYRENNSGCFISRVMLTSAVGHWLTIQLKKVFMGKEKK